MKSAAQKDVFKPSKMSSAKRHKNFRRFFVPNEHVPNGTILHNIFDKNKKILYNTKQLLAESYKKEILLNKRKEEKRD